MLRRAIIFGEMASIMDKLLALLLADPERVDIALPCTLASLRDVIEEDFIAAAVSHRDGLPLQDLQSLVPNHNCSPLE